MESEYGFIGEIKYEEDGTMFLHNHAITNIAWNQATLQFYEDNVDAGRCSLLCGLWSLISVRPSHIVVVVVVVAGCC